MPAKRDYKRERSTESQKRKDDRVKRRRNRRQENAKRKKAGKAPLPSNVHLDHKKKLSEGGSNKKSNIRKRGASANSADNGKKGGRPKGSKSRKR